jgi:hypothetical protein
MKFLNEKNLIKKKEKLIKSQTLQLIYSNEKNKKFKILSSSLRKKY